MVQVWKRYGNSINGFLHVDYCMIGQVRLSFDVHMDRYWYMAVKFSVDAHNALV